MKWFFANYKVNKTIVKLDANKDFIRTSSSQFIKQSSRIFKTILLSDSQDYLFNILMIYIKQNNIQKQNNDINNTGKSLP